MCTLCVGACHKDHQPRPAATGHRVRVGGSSTVYLVSKAVAEEAAKEHHLTVDVSESGTTAGFRGLCAGTLDVSGASRPIDAAEISSCRAQSIGFIELPIGYDGLALAVNAGNTWLDHLTTTELKRIWSPVATDAITNWKQVRDSFPDRPLRLYGPGKDSGTFDYFTQAIVGQARASRTDYTSSEDDMVLVRGISQDSDAVGYLGFAYVVRNPGIRAVAIDDMKSSNGDGPVLPSKASVANGTYQPLSRPIFVYVSTKALEHPEVERFVSFYLQVTRELAGEIGYVPLPQRSDELAKARFKSRVPGTLFAAGPPAAGMTMERLLEAQGGQP
ncbi:MAG TPA: PstS family phosphate ABC transporter substrate-binding protein [Vicinamibacterales bacterium]